jgi:death-on-curing protein
VRDDIVFLSVEDVVAVHDHLIERYGGSRTPGHRGNLDGVTAAVLAVENSYYDDLFELAVAYTVYIVMGHVFGDGNKRAGSAAALVFLELNGVTVRFKPAALLSQMIELQRRAEARPAPPASELVEWFAAWLQSVQAKPANS